MMDLRPWRWAWIKLKREGPRLSTRPFLIARCLSTDPQIDDPRLLLVQVVDHEADVGAFAGTGQDALQVLGGTELAARLGIDHGQQDVVREEPSLTRRAARIHVHHPQSAVLVGDVVLPRLGIADRLNGDAELLRARTRRRVVVVLARVRSHARRAVSGFAELHREGLPRAIAPRLDLDRLAGFVA